MKQASVFEKHQKAIARKTLAMSIEGQKIMGGMTHKEAFQIIFRETLQNRLERLLKEYPCAERGKVSTELVMYGWDGAEDWQELINSL